jgi:transcriptional regulator with XRE-family HTH domain
MRNVETRDILGGVGTRLRTLRQQRGVTLAQLSTETGISISTLSRLESGGRKPTLELLLPLAQVHQVPLDELVGAPRCDDPRVHTRPTVKAGVTYLPLTKRPGGMRAYKLLCPPGTPRSAEQQSHEGYEWLYVLAGRARLRLGAHDLILEAGEAAEFDTRTPHWFGNPGPGPLELLSIFGPQGERMHVRARPRKS